MPGRRPPTKPTKKLEWRLEIVYEYHPTEQHRREHWMYCTVTGTSPEECKENAKKYYEKQIRSVGWGRITTLKEIKPLTVANEPPKRKENTELTSARKPTTGGKPRKSTSSGKRKSSNSRKRKA